MCINLSIEMAVKLQLVTKTEQELDRGIKWHIALPKCQSFVNAYLKYSVLHKKIKRANHGVTGTAVRTSRRSDRIRLRRKIFRALRSRRLDATAQRTPPFPTSPTQKRVL